MAANTPLWDAAEREDIPPYPSAFQGVRSDEEVAAEGKEVDDTQSVWLGDVL